VTNAFWGEIPNGQWSIRVRDIDAADTGTWLSYSVLARMGTLIPANVPEPACLSMVVVGVLWLAAASRRRIS
jgi:hypothetical protein